MNRKIRKMPPTTLGSGPDSSVEQPSRDSAMTVRTHCFRAPRPKLAGGRGPARSASGRTAPRAADAALLAGRRAVLAATALVTLAGATAGCTAAGTSAAAPPAATTGAATGGTGNGGGAQAAVAECPAAGLVIKTGAEEAAAGHSYLTLTFTNSGATTCFLQGYPGAELATAGGGRLDAQRTTGGGTAPAPSRVTLTPGQSASALIVWEHFPQNGSATFSPADCPGYGATTLLVTAPDQTTSTRLTPPGTTSPVCWGFDVSPVVPGPTGRSPAPS
jgi:hypothetical protein